MSTTSRSDLNDRYASLSRLFRSGWTFHQFVQGVNKVFSSHKVELPTLSFQGVYGRLKAVPASLQSNDLEAGERHLQMAQLELDDLVENLMVVDQRVSAAVLRRFFERVKNYDRKILGQLLRFLILTHDRRWDEDRQDKADFLATRYRQENSPEDARRLYQELWDMLLEHRPELRHDLDGRVDDTLGDIASLREAMGRLDSLEQFNQLGLVQAFRTLKHQLGSRVFEPRVMTSVVDTNLFVRQAVAGFYEREERRIAAEYQEVFELERGARSVDDGLDDELEEFRDQVEALERSIEDQNVKLQSLALVGDRARSLIPRLRSAGDPEGNLAVAESPEESPVAMRSTQPVSDTNPLAEADVTRGERSLDAWQDGIQAERPAGSCR